MKKLNRESITVQFTAAILALILLLIVYGVAVTYITAGTIKSYQYVDSDIYTARQFVSKLEETEKASYFYAKGYNGYTAEDITAALEAAQSQLDKLGQSETEDSFGTSRIQQIQHRYDNTAKYVQQLLEASPEEDRLVIYRSIYRTANLAESLTDEHIDSLISSYGELNEENEDKLNRIYWLFFLVIGIMLCFTALMIHYILKRYTQPIRKIATHMSMLGQGDFVPMKPSGSVQEIIILQTQFNRMSEQLLRMIEKIKEAAKTREQLEFRLLQEQIKPHFLYNTLEMIIWQAETGDTQKIIYIVKAMSNFFRLALSNGREFITVDEEIGYIKSYLYLQSIRYADILSYDIRVSEETRELRLPKICLQPLVENAIYHGLKPTRRKGCVHIDVRIQSNRLALSVTDDGMGMSAEKLQEVCAGIYHADANRAKEPNERGFGLANVHHRLQLYYGAEYGVFLNSEQNRGTTVCVLLPLQRGEG